MHLELEYFERIDVNPRLVLLRLGAQPAPEGDVVLLVAADGDAHRTEPLAGSVAVEADGRWRAAFPVRRELMDAAGVTFALEGDETVDLPSPTDRVLVEEEPAPARESVPAEERRRRSNARLLWGTVVAGLLAAAAVVVFVLSQRGSDSSTTATGPPPAPRPATQALAALPGTGITAGARAVPLGHDRFSLRIRGLKAGTYQAWAFNSIIDCTPLATFKGPSATVTVTLPSDASRYHFLDVSREGDPSPNHSGLSVLRVSMAALTS